MNATRETSTRKRGRSGAARARGLITPAMVQQAQDLLRDHREAEAALALFLRNYASQSRVVLQDTTAHVLFELPAGIVTKALQADVAAIAAQLRKLGVVVGQEEAPAATPVAA
jgi:hypothetical protein